MRQRVRAAAAGALIARPCCSGAGYNFGKHVVDMFCERNQIDHILRAHQLCMEGYQVLFDNKLSTVWSAPNYCYRCGNKATILEVGANLERRFNFFEASELSTLADVESEPATDVKSAYFL